MINFKYDIVFGLLMWSIKDVDRDPYISGIRKGNYHLVIAPVKSNGRVFKTQHKHTTKKRTTDE